MQAVAEGGGYSVVREYVGHGIGTAMHEEPQVPNYGRRAEPALQARRPGCVVAIEPMVNAGNAETELLDDGWTVVTADGTPLRPLRAHDRRHRRRPRGPHRPRSSSAQSPGRYRAAMPDDHAELPPVDRAAFADRYGPRALVAGGAIGMGAEYCRQIAAMGIDLVILDRDESALDATARELRSAPDAVDVVTAVVDLGQPAEHLLDVVRRAVGDLEIGLLVANAAWSPVGPFLDTDLAALLAAIDINCRAPVVLVARARRAHGRAGTRRDHRHVVARGRDRCRERRAVLGDEGVRPRARRRPLVRAARPRCRRGRDPSRVDADARMAVDATGER